MSELTGWALLAGVSLGLGLWLLVSLAPRLSQPRLELRVAPYVTDVSVDARELLERTTANPLPVFGALLQPVVTRVQRFLAVVLGGGEVHRRRARQAGVILTSEGMRLRQLLWALAVAAVAVAIVTSVGNLVDAPAIARIAFVAVAAVAAFTGPDYLLQRRAAARLARMSQELPTVLEFLTLSLSAGEGVHDALRRVSRISRGELAAELSTVVAAVHTGLPLADSLSSLASQLQLPPLTRAVEQLVGAIERGTPLADVLRAQAQDSRDDSKRDLLELAGKKEVAMLVPLVFLILPMTVAIAIFPGLFVLNLGF